MPIAQDEIHYRYLLDILRALHIKRKDFMTKLAQNSKYEMMLYAWINMLFVQDKTKDEAIDFIYKCRYQCYCKQMR